MNELKFEWDENKNHINQKKYNNNFLFKEGFMKEEYDFSNAVKNPYARKLKRQVTINLGADTIDYFKDQAVVSGIPYQTLINLYLSQYALQKKSAEEIMNAFNTQT